jgi:hypothetical protein
MGFYATDDKVNGIKYRRLTDNVVKIVDGDWTSPKTQTDLELLESIISREYEEGVPVYIIAFRQRSWSTLDPLEPPTFEFWYPLNREDDEIQLP